ncbi:MAG: L-threonylcarbamoyladenylate synthase [Hyphomicrobiales bacterium]
MPAERLPVTDENRAEVVARVAGALRNGGLVVLPAEGVYGLHALAASEAGIARLERLKPRAGGKGWIGLVGRPGDLYRWVASVPAAAATLIRAHWPGPLTLVLDAGPMVPAPLRAADGTVALRCPGNALLREVVLAAGGLVVSTSANRPGAPPATRAEDAPEDGDVGLVVDAGPLSGSVSTLARVRGEVVTVLREGAVRIAGTAP